MHLSNSLTACAHRLGPWRSCLGLTLWLGTTGIVSAAEPEPAKIQMVDVTASTGITFEHHTGGSGRGYIVEGGIGALATFDYDNDGWIDIYFTNGAPLPGTEVERPLRPALYRNNGNWSFTDVTADAGLNAESFGLGCVVGDYDNDGDQDLYLNNFGPNKLYRNNGDQTFTDVTEEAGVANGHKVGAGANFLDIDRDGWLDLFVANYVDFTFENHVPIVTGGHTVMAGPQYYKSMPPTLYRNRGDGSFEDVSQASGIAAVAGPGMGTVAADFDEDGDTDIFVAQDGEANFLFLNDGKGHFSEEGLFAGVACDISGHINGSMGVDCGDADGDGKLDLIVTNYQAEIPVLYRNLGGGLFEDATRKSRITNELLPHVTWGTGMVDFDNDSDLDIYIACGHFERVELMDDRTKLKVPNFLLMNTGNGVFTDISHTCGSGLAVVESSRGTAFDDLDNDGDLDVVVLNASAAPTIIRNDTPQVNHWLQVTLASDSLNRDAVGAYVKLVAGDHVRSLQTLSGRGYQSHFGSRLQFGLGSRTAYDSIQVRWPDGTREIFPAGASDRHVTLKKNSGKPALPAGDR